jgi:hypothetical protein
MFSGGVASWAAARRLVDRDGPDGVTLLFTDTRSEDEDLYRFLDEAAADIGVPLVKLADGIEKASGDVWPAINRFNISYPHALRIRNGWRGAGRVAAPLPYHSRAWTSGRRNGWSSDFDVIDGGAA